MSSSDRDVRVRRTITIHRPAQDLYAFWRDLRNVPRYTHGVSGVEVIDERRSRWSVKVPVAGAQEWESTIVQDEPGRLLVWENIAGKEFKQGGTVSFGPAPGDLGSEVTLEVRLDLPGGKFTAALAKLMGKSPEDYVVRTLRNFKQLIETGEVATNQGPSGRQKNKAREGGAK